MHKIKWLYAYRSIAVPSLAVLPCQALLASRLRAVEGWCSIGNQCAMRGCPLIVFNNVYCIAG